MSSKEDFQNTIKQASGILPGTETLVSVQIVPFINNLMIQISYNGEMDSTYRIPVPNQTVIGNLSGLETSSFDEYDKQHGLNYDILDQTSSIEPTCLSGDSNNMKMNVVCCQLMLMLISVSRSETRDMILTISSKLFRGEINTSDFDHLFFVMGLMKQCLSA